MSSLRGLVDLIGLSSRSKETIVTGIRANGASVEPGLWVATRIGSAARVTRGMRSSPEAGRWTRLKGGRAKVLLLTVAVAVAPPMIFRVRGAGGASRALATKAGGLILFDDARKRVVHVAEEPYPADYAERRRFLSEYLPAPAAELSADRLRLTEDLAAGVAFESLAPGRKRAIARDFMAKASFLVEQNSSASATAVVASALAAADRAEGLPEHVASRLPELRPALAAAAATWPLIPAHGDLTGLNILVEGEADWSLIDFEDADDLPFFYDAACLLLSDPDLRPDAVNGAFDDDLRRLAQSAGTAAEPAHLDLYLAATALIAADRHATRHGGRFGQTVQRLWPPVDPPASSHHA
ncbi:phosphotransferase [Planctomonas psychrotolerans]|uniref:phosphotransferase n=1 Tax=Planctomonas psychrotolerans TaxID=2528712 RepID=UPI00123BBE97|nr:phosphotransferase [Planctomonas psychrotolerans]